MDGTLLADLVAPLEPITLAAVTRDAALQTRVDHKYLVPDAVLGQLVASLGGQLRVLDIGGRRAFDYESVYFDTASLRLYRDHVQGRRVRHKVRTRCYVDSELTMLEVKAKGGRGETIKHRLPWQPEDLERIHGGGVDFVAAHLGTRVCVDDLEPVLRSCYRRTTLVDQGSSLRLTCDVELRYMGFGRVVAVPGGRVLVETKSRTGRSEADRLLHRYGVRDLSVSKYCAGVALLRDLPANRWHRAVHRYLRPAPISARTSHPQEASARRDTDDTPARLRGCGGGSPEPSRVPNPAFLGQTCSRADASNSRA